MRNWTEPNYKSQLFSLDVAFQKHHHRHEEEDHRREEGITIAMTTAVEVQEDHLVHIDLLL